MNDAGIVGEDDVWWGEIAAVKGAVYYLHAVAVEMPWVGGGCVVYDCYFDDVSVVDNVGGYFSIDFWAHVEFVADCEGGVEGWYFLRDEGFVVDGCPIGGAQSLARFSSIEGRLSTRD